MLKVKSRPAREAMQIYINRDYVLSRLDEKVFDLMNTDGGGAFLACTGCLDALDEIPAGSIKASNEYYDASYITRGRSAEDQARIDAFMTRMLDEILLEESQNA